MRTFQRFVNRQLQSLASQCLTERCKSLRCTPVSSGKEAYPVLCSLFTISSILRLPALWSGSERPTPQSGTGPGGMVGVGLGVELGGESEDVTKELIEEEGIGLTSSDFDTGEGRGKLDESSYKHLPPYICDRQPAPASKKCGWCSTQRNITAKPRQWMIHCGAFTRAERERNGITH